MRCVCKVMEAVAFPEFPSVIHPYYKYIYTRMILPRSEHLEVVGKLSYFGDPESYASGRG